MTENIDLVEQEEWLALGRAVERALRRWPDDTCVIDGSIQSPLRRAYRLVAADDHVAVRARRVPDRPTDDVSVARSAADLAELESRMVTGTLVLAITQTDDGSAIGVAAYTPVAGASWAESIAVAPGSMTLDVGELALARLETWMASQLDWSAELEDSE